MSIRDQQRERVVVALVHHLGETGLGQTTLRELATAAGVSDRMLLYYFPDKNAVLETVMERIASDLGATLDDALPADVALKPAELIVRAARVTTGEAMRPFMRLWVQIVAAAARNERPYAEMAQHVMSGFQLWIESRLHPLHKTGSQGVTTAILALIDGLALIEICVGLERVTEAIDAVHDLIDG
jgi:AcrR family transcriptional regulator